MITRMPIGSTAFCLLLLSYTTRGSAQRPADDLRDSIPRALAEALIAPSFQTMATMLGGAGGRPRLIVGSLPSGLAERLWIPPGATVLGGLESSAMGMAVFRSNLSRDSLTAEYRRHQPALGWTSPPPRSLTPVWGFAPARGSRSDPDQALLFCSGGTVLVIGIEPLATGQEISARAMAMGRGLCEPRRADMDQALSMRRPYHPTLTNPPGTSGFDIECAGWTVSGGGGQTRLRTRLSAGEVLAHYATQLADSGWDSVADDQLVSRTWTRTDSAGAFMELTLTAQRRPAAPDCVEVEMRVNARRRR